MGIKCGLNTSKALNLTNNIRLRNSRLKVSLKYRNQRQKLQSRRKNKGKVDDSYIHGAFSSHILPDTLMNIEVTFIPDEDVKEFIVLQS